MNVEDYLSEKDVAEILGKSVITIRNWRTKAQSCGPRFLKIGHNVRYRRSDIDAWIEGCVVDPTDRKAGVAA